MKTGRNAPCPCGSGKKYKKCCLRKADVSPDLLWRRLGEAHDRLVDRLMKHAFNVFGEEAMGEALFEFLLWPEDDATLERSENHEQLFYPWFLFNWITRPNMMSPLRAFWDPIFSRTSATSSLKMSFSW